MTMQHSYSMQHAYLLNYNEMHVFYYNIYKKKSCTHEENLQYLSDMENSAMIVHFNIFPNAKNMTVKKNVF